jgi:hypothetical protein
MHSVSARAATPSCATGVKIVLCQCQRGLGGSVWRSKSDAKKSDLSESDQYLSDGRYRPISEHASRTLRCPMSDIGLGLVASQPTHASILLLMTCFAQQINESREKHSMPWFSYEMCNGFIIKTCEQCVNLNQCAQHCSFCVTTCPSLDFDPSQDWSKCFCLSGYTFLL